jgi:hypothetical protein
MNKLVFFLNRFSIFSCFVFAFINLKQGNFAAAIPWAALSFACLALTSNTEAR